MDICNQFDLHGPSCLYVTGISEAYSDTDIADFFKVNGDIKKIVRVPDDPDQPQGRVIIEYSMDRTISRLDPAQLGNQPSPNDPGVTWHVKTIREVCQEELGRELAQRCLAELSSLAGASKTSFWDALQPELQRAQPHSVFPSSPDTHIHSPDQIATSLSDEGEALGGVRSNTTNEIPQNPDVHNIPSSAATSGPTFDQATVNPPYVQKVIVEHFIRNDSSTSSYSQSRIRTFSGRVPKPNGEVDYDAWHTQVDLLLSDMSLSDSQKVRRILESLLSPAADIVKPLGTNAAPQAYLNQLDSAFGVVEDGEELFATFLGSNQNSGEKPSIYLNRLQTLLTKAISRGGVLATESDKYLLRQFCRGCWDQSLIVSLQLEQRKGNPPSFSDLLLLLRTEEDRRAAKIDRMKKHLGSAKAATHMHSVLSLSEMESEPATTTTKKNDSSKLEKEVAELRKQVEQLTHERRKEQKPERVQVSLTKSELPIQSENLLAHAVNRNTVGQTPTPPRPWFCFKCGADGHIAAKCSFEANPGLVRQKNAELRDKRDKFWAQHAAHRTSLNW